jgi:hypothetical protein
VSLNSWQRRPVLPPGRAIHKPLHANQKAFLRALYHVSDWIGQDALARQMGVGAESMPGIEGGLGLRCKHTRGWPRRSDTGTRPLRWIVLMEKRGATNFFCITPILKQALEETNVL